MMGLPPKFELGAEKFIKTLRLGESKEEPHNLDMEARLAALESAVKELPTKADLVEFRLTSQADSAKLRADFADFRAEVKTGVSELRVEMHKTNSEILKWMIATVIGLFLGFGGLFLAMSNALKSSASPAPLTTTQAQQPPIIINVPGPATSPAQEK